MPVHVIQSDDAHPHQDVLARALENIERRERIVQVQQAGSGWVVVTEKKAGRPAKETRVTTPNETR